MSHSVAAVRLMRSLLVLIVIAGALTALPIYSSGSLGGEQKADIWDNMPRRQPHTDHNYLFFKPFADGPAVTRACLQCHADSASKVMQTTHWNWLGQEVMVPGHAQPLRIGKRNVINNFCIGVQSNWPACTMCHIGYGWEDEQFDFQDASRVDCLVCHDNSGTYLKKFRSAGVPDENVNLLEAARSVGIPQRRNCGGCHFQGGGGNAVKHGDMDETLLFPSERIDVHMGRHDMLCVDCHRTEQHRIRGRAMSVSVDNQNLVKCTDCHAPKPHADVRLNAHTDRLACQTCHIPHMAVDTGTKLSWDWSEAGQDLDITDDHRYLKIKGRFTWAKKVQPEYYWYNQTSTRYITGDRIDPSRPTQITAPLGQRDDLTAKIWPFKVHRGKQPYDTKHNYFLVPNVHGNKGFWTAFDWETALQLGSKVTGLPYSGSYRFAMTEMFFPLSHMVTRIDEALRCRDCHGERGRIDWQALGYTRDPLMLQTVPHEPVYLLDANDEPVIESGAPLSVANTCGICHELSSESFVASHGYHSSVQEKELLPERRQLMVDGPRIAGADDAQMNCFLCHFDQPDHAARRVALENGDPEWSVSATLLGSGMVEITGDGYQWIPERFSEYGEVELDLRPVSETHCGACHGLVHDGIKPLRVELGKGDAWTTEMTGQVFSPQPVRLSAMNHAGKDNLHMVWDVHAERLVTCGDCHYSQNRPERLAGTAVPARVQPLQGIRRRCEGCHSLDDTHTWLPEPTRHFQAVACESCHVGKLEMAARQAIDSTVMRLDGSPQISYRGITGTAPSDISTTYIHGYRPLLRVGKSAGENRKVLPYNLVTHWFWTDGAQSGPVAAKQLRQAWLVDDGYRPDIIKAFDTNRDGRLSTRELRLDSAARLNLICANLQSAGISDPVIRGEVQAYPIHHNIRHGDYVNRDCTICHTDGSKAPAAFVLAPYLPGSVKPVLRQGAGGIILDGTMAEDTTGRLLLMPKRDAKASWHAFNTDKE